MSSKENKIKKQVVYIIAEIGVNHNGCLTLAKKLICAAKQCGADAVKFQTFSAKRLVTEFAPKAEYQEAGTNSAKSQYQMLKKLELDKKYFIELKKICEKNNVDFLSSPFDEDATDFLYSIGLRKFKIPSGEITNIPFLKHIARKGCKILLSTGMSTMKEVADAIRAIFSTGNKKVSLLHCVTEYPAPYDQINLRAIITMQKKFKVDVGYSDHTIGIEIPVAAVALGAKIIEKHFTLDKNLPGPDHRASAEPDEFSRMVSAIRNAEKALGNGIKKPAKCEIKNISIVRKSLVAACEIRKGDTFSRKNLTAKRPGYGLSPAYLESLLGKKSKFSFQKDDMIKI